MGAVNHAVHDAEIDATHDATQTASYEIEHPLTRSVPSRVGRYEICEVLGAGAMGVVYRARDPELDREVAIKLVRGGGASTASGVRLLREAQAMARLRHPNVVPIFDVGPADSAVFVAMPLLERGTLRSWLRAGPRSLDAILDQFAAAGRGLAAAHAAGLVHRDFKPDNVLLGEGGEVQVADFGLARIAGHRGPLRAGPDPGWPDTLSRTGDVVGTPAYMAPEQLRGRSIDARADQFSFCVALWEALYGERPFRPPRAGSAHPLRARLDAIAAGPVLPPPRPGRPAWLAQLLARGLSADPDRRWPSLQALLDAIAAHRARRRWPRWLAAGLGAAGLVGAASAFAWPVPAPIVPVLPAVPLVHDGDLKAAAISPDGTKLALVTGDSLVIRGTEIGAEERTVVERGADGPITWSPDNRHLLVGKVPELAPVIQTELVDIDEGVRFELPVTGFATFLSSTEVAVTSYRQRTVALLPLGERAASVTTCQVPGEYRFLLDLAGLPDGTMVIETEAPSGDHHGLVILGRDCELRATFDEESISSFAVTDTRTLVALVSHDGFDEILEISLQGELVSRRRISGVLGKLLGRRHGTDYVTTLAPRTELVRVAVQHGTSRPVISVNGNASFRLAPDGETVAWIERDGRSQTPGLLWLSTLHNMARSQALLHDAFALWADWSPGGRSLAVLVDDGTRGGSRAAPRRSTQDSSTALAILDRSGRELRHLPLDHVDRAAAPVWLDDHRIAVRTDDRTTYRAFDLDTGEHGEIVDRSYGSTYALARSPRDGTLAMWRNGPPGAIDARTEHLWLQRPGHAARPLHVADAIKHFLVPSWSPSGELIVRAPDTGVVSRVALGTGELTSIARLPAMQFGFRYDDHIVALPDGDLLAVNHELGTNVAVVLPGDDSRSRRPAEPGPTPP